MAMSNFVRNAACGQITLADGTGTPVTLVVAFDMGDLSLGETGEKLNALNVYQRRGRFVSAGFGEREFVIISFSAYVTDMTQASGTGSIVDFLKRKAAYSANISTLGAGQPYTVNVTYALEGTNFGSTDETCGATHCYPRIAYQEAMDGNRVTVSLMVLGELSGAWATPVAFS